MTSNTSDDTSSAKHTSKKQKTDNTPSAVAPDGASNQDMSNADNDSSNDEPSDLSIAVMLKSMRVPDMNYVEPLRTESDEECVPLDGLDPVPDSDIPPRPQKQRSKHRKTGSKHSKTNRSEDTSQGQSAKEKQDIQS